MKYFLFAITLSTEMGDIKKLKLHVNGNDKNKRGRFSIFQQMRKVHSGVHEIK